MRFRIELSAEAERDFAVIFDQLFEIYLGFGETVESALDHCEERIRDIRQEADLLPSLRQLTIDRAIYWFGVKKAKQRICVLAIIVGRHNQVRHTPSRLLAP